MKHLYVGLGGAGFGLLFRNDWEVALGVVLLFISYHQFVKETI